MSCFSFYSLISSFTSKFLFFLSCFALIHFSFLPFHKISSLFLFLFLFSSFSYFRLLSSILRPLISTLHRFLCLYGHSHSFRSMPILFSYFFLIFTSSNPSSFYSYFYSPIHCHSPPFTNFSLSFINSVTQSNNLIH